MRVAVLAAAAAGIVAVGQAPATAEAVAGRDPEIERLVGAFLQAQRDRDVPALRRLTAPDYREVSPIGDVDEREAMLGFYAPAPGKVSPAIEADEWNVRRVGDVAIATVRLRYALPPPRAGGAARATYVAERRGGRWLLDAVQYTPIRAPAASPSGKSSPTASQPAG